MLQGNLPLAKRNVTSMTNEIDARRDEPLRQTRGDEGQRRNGGKERVGGGGGQERECDIE